MRGSCCHCANDFSDASRYWNFKYSILTLHLSPMIQLFEHSLHVYPAVAVHWCVRPSSTPTHGARNRCTLVDHFPPRICSLLGLLISFQMVHIGCLVGRLQACLHLALPVVPALITAFCFKKCDLRRSLTINAAVGRLLESPLLFVWWKQFGCSQIWMSLLPQVGR